MSLAAADLTVGVIVMPISAAYAMMGKAARAGLEKGEVPSSWRGGKGSDDNRLRRDRNEEVVMGREKDKKKGL